MKTTQVATIDTIFAKLSKKRRDSKKDVIMEHMNQLLLLLATPRSNPQSPEYNVVPREQGNVFNLFVSIEQPPIPFKQTASLFLIESNDNQRELIHSSIGVVLWFLNSVFITAPKTQLNQKTGAAIKPKNLSRIPSNSKTEIQSTQCFAFEFQNTLQQNSSADNNKTNQTSNGFRENEMLQTQYHSEKRRNKTTKITVRFQSTFF